MPLPRLAFTYIFLKCQYPQEPNSIRKGDIPNFVLTRIAFEVNAFNLLSYSFPQLSQSNFTLTQLSLLSKFTTKTHRRREKKPKQKVRDDQTWDRARKYNSTISYQRDHILKIKIMVKIYYHYLFYFFSWKLTFLTVFFF